MNSKHNGEDSVITFPQPLLVFVNAHRKIRKRMDTNVAFTRKDSRVSYLSTGNVKCSSKNQGRLKVKIE